MLYLFTLVLHILMLVASGGVVAACLILWRKYRTMVTAGMFICQCVLFATGVITRYFTPYIFELGNRLFGNEYGITLTIISSFSTVVAAAFAVFFVLFALSITQPRQA